MKSLARKQFWDCYDALPADVQALAHKTFDLWRRNPKHPSLHFKRVHSTSPLYSARIGRHWRALGLSEAGTMYWFWIGTHSEYDKIIRRF